MSGVLTGKLLAVAGSGLAVGATGMFVYKQSADATEPGNISKDPEVIASTSRALPSTAGGGSPVASDFILPFVNRYGLPDLDQIILPSQEYTSCWDSRTRNARWVVERINYSTITGKGDRSRASFRTDSRLEPLFRSELSDFRGSGLDRGHLAPAGDHKTTMENLKETFLLTNMSPQDPSFNRGYWSDFEEFVRTLAVPDDSDRHDDGNSERPLPPPGIVGPPFKDVYVITGPLYLPSKDVPLPGGTIHGGSADDGVAVDGDGSGVVEVRSSGASGTGANAEDGKWVVKHDIIGSPMRMVAVPTHFFKVIIAEPFLSVSDSSATSPKTYVAAFAMPNTKIPNNYDLRNFLVPIEALESVAGMRFLGAASSSSGNLDEAAREFLDNEAVQVRAAAGVPALTADWVNRKDNGYRRLEAGEDTGIGTEREKRLFRHLCTVTSCKGL